MYINEVSFTRYSCSQPAASSWRQCVCEECLVIHSRLWGLPRYSLVQAIQAQSVSHTSRMLCDLHWWVYQIVATETGSYHDTMHSDSVQACLRSCFFNDTQWNGISFGQPRGHELATEASMSISWSGAQAALPASLRTPAALLALLLLLTSVSFEALLKSRDGNHAYAPLNALKTLNKHWPGHHDGRFGRFASSIWACTISDVIPWKMREFKWISTDENSVIPEHAMNAPHGLAKDQWTSMAMHEALFLKLRLAWTHPCVIYKWALDEMPWQANYKQ